MSSIIGSGVIEVSADSRKLTAGIDDAKRSLKSLGIAAGEATKGQSQSIDRYVKSLGTIAVTAGKSGRELEIYKLALRGATAEQLKAADSALRMSDAYARGEMVGQKFRTGIIAIGAASVLAAGAFSAMIISSINAADNLNDLSKKTGVSVEDLSGLSLAAKQSGTDLEGVAASISKLSVNIGKDPDKYKALGISTKDPIEAFKQLADIFAAVQDPQQQAALGAEALGKSWQSAAPLLAEGSKSIGEMVDKGKKLSGVTQEAADQADKFNDQLAEMRAVTDGLGMKMAGEMLPALNDIAKAVKLAYEESGKLSAAWVALGSVGAFLFTDEFASATTKIRDLQFELKSLEKKKENTGFIDSMLFGSKNDIIGKIAAVKNQIASLQDSDKPKPAAPKPPASTASTAGVAGFIKTPKTSGGAGAGKNPVEQEAKAQLALDLENIKIKSGQMITAYSNGEKIMESLRSAGLIDESDYYASKLKFLQLNSAAEEQSLTDQIARMSKENLVGKSKLDNDKKIAEANAKRDTVKASGATGATVLGIQSEAAGTKRNSEVDDFFAKAQDDAAMRNIANVEAIKQSAMTQLEAEQEGYKLRMDALTEFRDSSLANRMEGNQLIEFEEKRHKETLESLQLAAGQNVLSIAQSSADQLYSALKEAGLEQTALGKAMFAVQKGLQIASIIVNTEVAAAAAQAGMIAAAAATAAISGPAGPGILAAGVAAGASYAAITRAIGYASAGLVAGTAIASASAEGGYDIPDGVNPVVQTHAREMILPRAQANVIRDLAKDGGTVKKASGAITIVNNTSAKIGKVTEQRLSNGERALIIEEAVAATAAQFSDPNSKTSRALSRNYSTQRSR